VRIIQWEAATLGKRVILSAAVGMVTFLLAMVRRYTIALS
jgi:hypothetical protein